MNAVAPAGTQGDAPTGYLRLGRLAGHYDRSHSQLPQVTARNSIQPDTIELARSTHTDSVRAATTWSFLLPTGQLIAALTVDVHCDLLAAVNILEDCYNADVTIGGAPLDAAFDTLRPNIEGPCELLPERHQLVFVPTGARLPGGRQLVTRHGVNEDYLQRLVYRADLPYRPEYSSIRYPPELNRRPTAAAGIGPYVSVLVGQQDYVENGAFLSAIQAVSSAARLREIRSDAYDSVRELDLTPTAPLNLRERRQRLEAMADNLSRIEVDLSRGVEAPADLALLVPSLRLNSYHTALFDCMSLTQQSDTVARMISRVEHAIAADLTSIESAERRADDRRRLRWAVAVGFISTVAVPVTLVLGFFGINSTEVAADTSMFDQRYLPVYALSAAFVITAAALFAALYLQHRAHEHIHPATPSPSPPPPEDAHPKTRHKTSRRRAGHRPKTAPLGPLPRR